MSIVEARNLVAGRWVGDVTAERRNPARPEEVVTRSAVADREVVDQAIESAQAAQPSWAAMAAPQRGAVLMRAATILEARADAVARDLTREEGKTLRESTAEVTRAASILRYFGSQGWRPGGRTYPSSDDADAMVYTRRESLGVVVAICPWNFPIAIPAWKVAPALLAGNAVILKPAGLSSGTAWHLASALTAAGVPEGVISLLLGSGSEIGDALVGDARVAAVSFTGSVEVGRRIHGRVAGPQTRVQLEMGGKNALVVLDDADPQVAARIAAVGGFGLTGQACTATSRVIGTRGIMPRLVEALVEEARRYEPGDGQASDVLMGPLVSERRLDSVRDHLAAARATGARVVTGDQPPEGLFQMPVVVTGVDARDRLAQEEVFGPVIAMIEVDDVSGAISAVNATRYGLTAGIVTADLGATQRFVSRARVGVVKVNQPTTGLELHVPFGGVGESSNSTFREQGDAAIDFYSWSKSVYLAPPPWTAAGDQV